MYNIWCEIDRLYIMSFAFCIIATIISYIVYESYVTLVLFILSLLYALTLFVKFIKYISLKNYGVLLKDIPYSIKSRYKNEKVIIIEFDYQDKHYKFYKNKIYDDIQDSGTTSVLFNPNKKNQYYVFEPQ